MPFVTFYKTTISGSRLFARLALLDGEIGVLEGPPGSELLILDHVETGKQVSLVDLMRTMPALYDGNYLRAEYIENGEKESA